MVSAPLMLALEERRRQALLAGDLPALQALLAQGLVYVHSTGGCDSKESYLAKLSSGSLRYLDLALSELQVHPMEHAAVVTGRMAAVVSKDGQRKNIASLFMTVWGCDVDGVWRLHAYQGRSAPTA